jgi:membrane protein DedA with SNARE-associated domain
MSFTESLVNLIVEFIDKTGYSSVFVLMSLESMVAPVPSEAVMPFAGFLVHSGRFTFTGVIFFSTLGSIFGSLISYYLGYWGGRPIVERFGKYLLLDKKDLDLTERFFQKRGDITIFISRFIPIVRHLISIPAGIGKMNIYKFCIYTIIGAGLWNAFLTYMGFILKNNWKEIMKYSHVVDIVVLALLVIFVIYYIYKFYSNHKERKANKDIVS